MYVKTCLSAFALGLFAATLGAQDQAAPRFAIDTFSDAYAGCTLSSLAANWALQFSEAGMRRAVPGFIELRQEGRGLPALLTRDFLLLTNGDRLPLDPDAAAKLEDNRLHVWPAKSLGLGDKKGLSLFAPHVVLVFWSLPEGVDDADRFFAKLAVEPRKRDVVFLTNGDRIEGNVTELAAKAGCVIATDAKKVHTPWADLAGIAWSTDRQAPLRVKKAYARAVLAGGARVNFLELRFEEKERRFFGKTQFGATLEVPESGLLAVEMRQAQAVELSALKPARYEQRPYLGAGWPLQKDAAVTGRSLCLGGNTYEKGLGTHAPCRVAYKLDGLYQRFEALVGIDETARRGRARVAVEVDGKRVELNDGKELTSQTPPLSVRLDVRKARELVLIVDLGSFGDVQAHVNWAKARLIKRD